MQEPFEPIIDLKSKKCFYGLYPQSVVNKNLYPVLDNLKKSEINDWVYYNGEYYAKRCANLFPNVIQCTGASKYENGQIIDNYHLYWFKCEPIEWDILSIYEDQYLLISRKILDTHAFDDLSNDYNNSSVKEWLNNYFYDQAFALNKSNVLLKKEKGNEERIFLLGLEELLNEDYSFTNKMNVIDKLRSSKTTDYSRARGATYSHDSPYKFNGFYWTKTADKGTNDYVICVNHSGYLLVTNYIRRGYVGIRPACWIKKP